MTRAVVALASAIVLLAPADGSAATTLEPDRLRALLPDVTESGLTEVPLGATGYLDGPITIESMRAYYQFYSQAPDWIDSTLSLYQENGFVAGYGRQWYRPGTQESLVEELFVFAKAAGASKYLKAAYVAETQQFPSLSTFSPGIASDEFGQFGAVSGFHFAALAFIVGNAGYGVARVSATDLGPKDILGQGKAIAAQAPKSIPVTTSQQSQPAPASRLSKVLDAAPVVIAGMLITLGVAAIVALLVLAWQLRRRPASAALPVGLVRSPDGAYWWDGTFWRPLPQPQMMPEPPPPIVVSEESSTPIAAGIPQ